MGQGQFQKFACGFTLFCAVLGAAAIVGSATGHLSMNFDVRITSRNAEEVVADMLPPVVQDGIKLTSGKSARRS